MSTFTSYRITNAQILYNAYWMILINTKAMWHKAVLALIISNLVRMPSEGIK